MPWPDRTVEPEPTADGGHPVGQTPQPGTVHGRATVTVVDHFHPDILTGRGDPDHHQGGAGVLSGVRQRLADQEVGRLLDGVRQPAAPAALHRRGHRRALGERRHRRLQTPVRELRWVDATGQVTELAQGRRQLVTRLAQ